MNIKAKSTAVAIATVSSVFSFSIPSQASEYEYLYELDKLAKQQDVTSFIDTLSASKKLKFGKKYCTVLEYGSTKDIYGLFKKMTQTMIQKGFSRPQIDYITVAQTTIIHASVKELCPAYEYKFNKTVEAIESAKNQQLIKRQR